MMYSVWLGTSTPQGNYKKGEDQVNKAQVGERCWLLGFVWFEEWI